MIYASDLRNSSLEIAVAFEVAVNDTSKGTMERFLNLLIAFHSSVFPCRLEASDERLLR